ncbi:MAG: hypothetical protein RRB22_12720 [Gammaproteobacteria bacterium]|nr:hypothetical protein [Gammaproteobacteria bacterium]
MAQCRAPRCAALWRTLIPGLCAASLFAPPLQAGEAEDRQSTDLLPRILMLEPLDVYQDAAAEGVTQLANWLDNFFANDLVYDEHQKSHVKLNLVQVTEEGYEPRYEVNLQGKLTLPDTEDRLKILLENDPEEDAEPVSTVTQAVESTRQSLGLRYIQYTSDWLLAHTDVGIRYRSGFDSFARFRLRGLYAAGDWQFRLAETLFWRDSTGAGETTRLDIERRLSRKDLLRSTSQATWMNESRQFDMGQNFYLIHDINKYRGIIYRAGLTAVSEPDTHTTAYILSIQLRQQIHSNWLFFEINPQILYPEEDDFHARHSLSFKLEMVFGGS